MGNVKVIAANPKKSHGIKGLIKKLLKVCAYCRVSTGTEEQKTSYESQKKYYKQKIKQNPEWELVDIYADEAISGTQVYKRVNFKRMIDDALAGKIDLILVKSISRFGRNTVDILKYIRLLKEHNVDFANKFAKSPYAKVVDFYALLLIFKQICLNLINKDKILI